MVDPGWQAVTEQLSIRAYLGPCQKRYLSTLQQCGYETGVGRAGAYEPHGHRAFVDTIYSPLGVEVQTADGAVRRPKLVAVQPNSPLLAIAPGDFWFIKFYPNRASTEIKPPDKYLVETPEPSFTDYLCLDRGAWRTSLWIPGSESPDSVLFELGDNGDDLTVMISGEDPLQLRVGP